MYQHLLVLIGCAPDLCPFHTPVMISLGLPIKITCHWDIARAAAHNCHSVAEVHGIHVVGTVCSDTGITI